MRIIVVEDEAIIAQDIAWIAENLAGYTVDRIVSDVDEALAIISAGQVDGAVLDANLNGQSTEAIAKELKRQSIPFFLVSGAISIKPLPPELADAPFLEKPYSEPDLLQHLRNLR
jgi:DNA-binding response OmpR family regulator